MAPRKKTDRVTIKTVAEDAGVSVAAVSKVLRDAYGVSAELRSKVQASMLRLNYRPHAAARGMRGQTYTLGVLLPDLRNPFFGDIMSGVNSALERTQYQPLLGISESATSIEQALIDAMNDRQMDGLILIGPRMLTKDLMAVAERTPMVLIGHHPPPGDVNFDTVNNDDRLGAQLVVRHLVEMGYRNIAYLNQVLPDTEQALVTTQREIGFLAAMAELGLSRHASVVKSLQTPRETQTATRHVLQLRHPPEAIFCWTDFIALEVLSVAKQLGLRVPEDVAVVGYDNTSYCDLAQNSLTSIDQSGQVLGLQAARLLIERIKGRETAEHLVITPRLVARQSSGPKRG
ncbi:MAG: LacI family DNA-binding transcriptional regulator [Devosia sp.]|nr:LacI family DNA-binding transcriptional regulator [Devosia sp.]